MRICNPVSVLVQAVTLRDNNHQGSGLKKYSKKNPPHPTLMNPTFQNSGDERHPHHLNSSKHRWRGPLGLKRGCWEDFGMDPTGIDLISAHGPKKKEGRTSFLLYLSSKSIEDRHNMSAEHTTRQQKGLYK